jgi:hypothetical protein
MSQPPVLRYFDANVTQVLQCDASMNGLGDCLLQINQPVAYASRSLTPTEVQYAQIEKEMHVGRAVARRFKQGECECKICRQTM